MNLPDFKTWSFKMQSEKYLSKYYPEFLDHLNTKYYEASSLKEKIYLYLHDLDHPQTCKVCGKYTKYINSTKGYSIYCSSQCCNSDIDKKKLTECILMDKYGVSNPSQLKSVKEKKKQTSLKNWGMENPSQSPTVRNKFKDTMLNKYGVEHPSQLESVKEKKRQTSLKNWGVEHPSQLESVKEKKRQTSLKNWGTLSPMSNLDVKNKVKQTYNRTYILSHPDIINILEEDGERIYICKCENLECNKCVEKQYEINHTQGLHFLIPLK